MHQLDSLIMGSGLFAMISSLPTSAAVEISEATTVNLNLAVYVSGLGAVMFVAWRAGTAYMKLSNTVENTSEKAAKAENSADMAHKRIDDHLRDHNK